MKGKTKKENQLNVSQKRKSLVQIKTNIVPVCL